MFGFVACSIAFGCGLLGLFLAIQVNLIIYPWLICCGGAILLAIAIVCESWSNYKVARNDKKIEMSKPIYPPRKRP